MNSIRYHCGTEAMVGDVVDFDGILSIVETIIVSDDELELWGFESPGIMFTNKEMGRVFESADSCSWPENVFIRRSIHDVAPPAS